MCHQPDRERRGDESGSAKAHDGHAGRHAGTIWKPFNQGRHGRDVTKAEAAAAQDAITQINDPEIVDIDAERRNQEATAEATSGHKHGLPWAAFLDPAAKNRC